MAKYASLSPLIHNRILGKKKKLQSMGKLSSEKIKQIHERMRVDFVYNSNKMEGSTLTRGETELILRGITVGKKSIQDALGGRDLGDILVAQNHSDAIELVKKLAFDKTSYITEKNIKDIHGIVMKGVIVSAGNIRNYDLKVMGAGFTPPPFYNISKNMKEFVEMLNKNPDELLPIELAAQVHYDFVWIHPFEDGNGRMSRLLLNLILVRNGYPFAVIQSVDKKKYLKTLRQMDVKYEFEAFLTFIARCIEQTLDLYLYSGSKSREKLLPLSKLAKNTPHSAEYWSLLARKGRIDAIKEGKTWKTSRKIIKAYLAEQNKKKN